MFNLVFVASLVFASAQAGLLHAGSFATGPALEAPLVGSVTYNAPETTIVKQPVVVDQPEIRYRAVPTVVQAAPIVRTAAVVQAAPIVKSVVPVAQPAIAYAAAPAVTYAAAPALSYAAAPALSYAAAPAYYGSYPAANFAYGYTTQFLK